MSQQIIDEILDFAMARERMAHDFYQHLAAHVTRPGMREVLLQFAEEEEGHRAKLQRVRQKRAVLVSGGRVADLKLSDYLVEAEAEAELDYQDALILAMKREKASFRLYTDLAAMAEDDATRELFLALAQEEARHKLRFEIEHDDAILPES